MVHPIPGAPLRITTDASDNAMGAALEQESRPGKWEPLSFYSKGFTQPESKWPAYEKELRAIFNACRHFQGMTHGSPSLTVFTDHKPIIGGILKDQHPNDKQARWYQEIAQHTTDFRHIEGKLNHVAD